MRRLPVSKREDATSSQAACEFNDAEQADAPRFTLATLFYAVTVAALACGLGRCFGFDGIAIAADITLLSLVTVRCLNSRGWYAIECPEWTIIEWGVLLCVCLILHGLALPAVQSTCPSRSTVPTQTSIGPSTSNALP